MNALRKIKPTIPSVDLFHIVQIIIFTFAIELLLSSIMFLIGLSITWYFLAVSFGISILLCEILNEENVNYSEILIAMAIFVFFSWTSGKFFDVSWDGNAYHKLAIGLLKNHWNPLHSLPSLSLTEGFGVESFGNTRWVESYCKATWIWGASVYALTENIETGKSYTMIAMLCLFMLVFYYMKKTGYKASKSIMIACVAALNPIAVQQMFSFYIDGFLHTMLLILVISLLMLNNKEIFNTKVSISMVVASMIICGNIKFTGLLYGGIFCIAYYLKDCLDYIKNDEEWIQKIFKEGLMYFLLAIVTVVWAGSSSYVTNFVRHDSLTYPLTGEGKVDIMTANSPFAEVNHFENLFMSLFSRFDNFTIASDKTVELKIPFTFNKAEISKLALPDARLSGFGVIFGGLFILAILILAFWLILSVKNDTKTIIGLNMIVCLSLMFGIKESWWARYSPYIYMILLMAVYVVLLNKRKQVQILAIIFFGLIMINNCLPLKYVHARYQKARTIDAYFCELKNNGPIEICNREFEGVYYNYKDYNIDYYVNNKLVDDEDVNVADYQLTLWKSVN